MTDDVIREMAAQLLDCTEARETQRQHIERLYEQIRAREQQHKIDVENAYNEGYADGKRDALESNV